MPSIQDNPPTARPAWFVDALAALGRHAFLTASQLGAFLAAHRDDVAPVLGNLLAEGLLQMLVPTHSPGGGPVEAAYILTHTGARLLRTLQEHAHVRAVRADKSRYTLAHDLVRNEFAVVLELLEKQQKLTLLRWETAREKIAMVGYVSDHGIQRRVPLVADGLAVVDVNGAATALLVEIDKNTIAIDRMAQKYKGYIAWFREQGPARRFGIKSLRVLTVAPTEARLKRLRAAALDATGGNGSGFFWFLPESAIDCADPEKILAPVCTVARAGEVGAECLFA